MEASTRDLAMFTLLLVLACAVPQSVDTEAAASNDVVDTDPIDTEVVDTGTCAEEGEWCISRVNIPCCNSRHTCFVAGCYYTDPDANKEPASSEPQ